MAGYLARENARLQDENARLRALLRRVRDIAVPTQQPGMRIIPERGLAEILAAAGIHVIQHAQD